MSAVKFTRADFLACLKVTQGYRDDEAKREAFADFVADALWHRICLCGADLSCGDVWAAFGLPGYFHCVKRDYRNHFSAEYWDALSRCESIQSSNYYAKLFDNEKTRKTNRHGRSHGKTSAADAPVLVAVEGAPIAISATERKKRNRALRDACVKAHGAVCAVCGFDFGKVYGEIGEGFIHVHHLNPLAESDGAHEVNAATDLVPLCANCHAMAHRKTPPIAPEELRRLIRKTNGMTARCDAVRKMAVNVGGLEK